MVYERSKMKDIFMKNVNCNRCNKLITGDCLEVNKEWGYFSNKDTRIDKFVLCEKCYDEIIKGFAKAIQSEFKKEVI